MGKVKNTDKKMDMLHGPLLKKIILFALPIAASSILQQMFNSADTAVVGRFAGSLSLAAVGGTSMVVSMLITLFTGISVGANAVIAHCIGEGRNDKIQEVVHTVITLALVCGALMLCIGQFIARPILILMDTPADVLDLAVLYLRIFFIGMPFFMIYNFGSAILRSVADTKRPMYALIISGIVNVLLNLLFVIKFRMGVSGVATATVISNGVSSLLVLHFLRHGDERIRVNLKKLRIVKSHISRVLAIGIPAGLQGMVFAVSNIFVQTGVNSFGSSAVAGSSAAASLELFSYFVVLAFAQAAVTFAGQNYGAGLYERCRKVFRLTMLSGVVAAGMVSLILTVGSSFFLSIFTTDSEALYYAGIRVFRTGSFIFIVASFEITSGVMRGMGRSLLPSVLTILGSCVLRVLWVYTVFRHFRTFDVLLDVYLITWIITGIMVLTAYNLMLRKTKRQI